MTLLKCFATIGGEDVVKMKQQQIDEFLRILDDVLEQLGEPGGYDVAIKRLEEASKDQQPQSSFCLNLGMNLAEAET
jgi:hypothetical protein